jgi:hypothetical protein
MAADSFNEHRVTARKAALRTSGSAEAPKAAVRQSWPLETGADPVAESVIRPGLGFFDFARGQDVLTPNAIERRPVTDIEFHRPAAAPPPVP